MATATSTVVRVPSLSITFTDEELAAVRAAAANDDMSLRAFAHRAVMEAASGHNRRVAEAARIVADGRRI